MAAIEMTMPAHTVPTANESRFVRGPLSAFDMAVKLGNGHKVTITTVARNSAAAIENMSRLFGEQTMKGITPKRVL
jgi:hypothetical protein